MIWTYGKTADVALLNKLIDDRRSVLAHRNDKFEKYKLIYGDVGLLWPHFRGLFCESDGSVTMGAGCESISAFTWMTVTTRAISEQPDLWSETYNRKTYKAIAEEMIDASLECVDYYFKI